METQRNEEHDLLAVYQLNSVSGSLILMDSMEVERNQPSLFLVVILGGHFRSPSIDRHSHRVFLPVRDGVLVARLEGDKLVKERILHSGNDVYDLVVIPLHTLYVSDWHSGAVSIIDGIHDTVTATLKTPVLTRPGMIPYHLAVQGDNVVVFYGEDMIAALKSKSVISGYFSVVVYRHGSLTPIRILHSPDSPAEVLLPYLFTADSEGHVLLIKKKSVIVINTNVCRISQEINVNTDSAISGCTVVNRQLWVGCKNGDIVIMSSGEPQKESRLNQKV